MYSDIYEKIAIYCDKNQLFEPGDGVIVGLSGGADSVFLLQTLVKLQKRWNLRLRAVHVNHGIRGEEALRDQMFAVSFAEGLGISCEVEQADIPLLAKKWRMTEEEAGRTYRYQCFEEWREKLVYQKIAVAHHRDDQAETILFQLLRGSSLRGLGGMRPRRGNLVRPLLETGRQEIENCLREDRMEYCMDSTNEQDIYARNLLRHHVMPYLCDKVQPAAAEHIAQTGAHLRKIMDYIDAQTAEVYKRIIVRKDNGLLMKEEEFKEISDVLQREIILRMIQELAGQKKDITSVHIEQIQTIFQGGTGKMAVLPYCLRAEKNYDTLFLYVERDSDMRAEAAYLGEEIVFFRQYMLPQEKNGACQVVFESVLREKLSDNMLKNHCTKCFDYAKMVTMPIFRYPEEGDFLWLDSSGKTKKLSRIFIDEKIEKKEREKMLVLAIGHHILWIPALGRCSAYYFVLEDTTEIVLARLYG